VEGATGRAHSLLARRAVAKARERAAWLGRTLERIGTAGQRPPHPQLHGAQPSATFIFVPHPSHSRRPQATILARVAAGGLAAAENSCRHMSPRARRGQFRPAAQCETRSLLNSACAHPLRCAAITRCASREPRPSHVLLSHVFSKVIFDLAFEIASLSGSQSQLVPSHTEVKADTRWSKGKPNGSLCQAAPHPSVKLRVAWGNQARSLCDTDEDPFWLTVINYRLMRRQWSSANALVEYIRAWMHRFVIPHSSSQTPPFILLCPGLQNFRRKVGAYAVSYLRFSFSSLFLASTFSLRVPALPLSVLCTFWKITLLLAAVKQTSLELQRDVDGRNLDWSRVGTSCESRLCWLLNTDRPATH
jgi:hypothetical protein